MLLVGLGNPGEKYVRNRHNIGFLAVQEVLHRYSFAQPKDKFHSLYASGVVDGHKVHVLLPQTYMNDSGRAVQAAMQFFKLTPDDVYVIHDDLDLPPLKVRVKQGGGDGGHNGLKSITRMLGTPNYHRIRVGIGHPGRKELVSPYVLADFSKDEAPHFAELIVRLADGMPHVLDGDANKMVSDLACAFKGVADET